MILLNNAHSQFGANSAFAFLADGENVNSVLHGSEDGDEGKKEAASLFCCCSQGFIMICCFNDDALIVGAVDKEKAFHGGKTEERLAPRGLTIQQKGGWRPLVNKASQSSQLPLQEVPGPLAFSGGAKQLVAFVINDGITSAVHMPFNFKLPDAPAGAIRAVNANDVLSVLHCLSDVEDELLERGSLVAASCAGEIGAVVLVSLDGCQCHCGESEGTERNQPGRSS